MTLPRDVILLLLPFLVLFGCASGGKQLAATELFPSKHTTGELEKILDRQQSRGTIPAGALVIRKRGELVFEDAFGKIIPGEPEKATTETLFDIASLTKIIAGIPAGMLLLDEPETTMFERGVILRLFQHSLGLSDEKHYPGLQGIKPYFNPDTIRPPAYRYANANFLFLTYRTRTQVEVLTEKLRREFWRLVGTASFTWHPETSTALSGISASGELLIGEPFDPVANQMLNRDFKYTLHSGLFGSAADVALVADTLLHDDPGTSTLQRYRELLFGLVIPLNLRDKPSETIHVSPGGMISPNGPPFAPRGAKPGRFYYHTGYTGCLLWVDKEAGITAALLTNAASVDSLDEWEEFSHNVIGIIIDALAGENQ